MSTITSANYGFTSSNNNNNDVPNALNDLFGTRPQADAWYNQVMGRKCIRS